MPTATTSLTLATQKPFGNLTCDFWQDENNHYYMTRRQIGEALEYPNAEDQVKVIHSRHRDRFNPVSFRYQIDTPVGPSETYVYTLKGSMEICRFSRQPKADKFMDFVWDVVISLMQGETVLTPVQQQHASLGSVLPPSYLSKMEHSPAKATRSRQQLMSATEPPGTRSQHNSRPSQTPQSSL